jgi:hypothetical protein
MRRIDQIRVDGRREAIEECAALRAALRRLVEEWPDVTPATWDIAQALLAKVALADRLAPGVPPERNETPLHAPSIHRVQDNTYVREPSEAEVEAAWKVWIGSVSITPKEATRLALAAAAKVRAGR